MELHVLNGAIDVLMLHIKKIVKRNHSTEQKKKKKKKNLRISMFSVYSKQFIAIRSNAIDSKTYFNIFTWKSFWTNLMRTNI